MKFARLLLATSLVVGCTSIWDGYSRPGPDGGLAPDMVMLEHADMPQPLCSTSRPHDFSKTRITLEGEPYKIRDQTTSLFNMTSMAIGDVDGDGYLDLITGSRNLFVSINDGQGRFNADNYAVLTGQPSDIGALAVGDVNIDGATDILLGAGVGSGSICMANVSGCVMVVYGQRGKKISPDLRSLHKTGINNDMVAVASGDVNGDASPDLLAMDTNGNVFLAPGSLVPSGARVSDMMKQKAVGGQGNMKLGHVDNDGKLDLLLAGYNRGLGYVYINQGGPNELIWPLDPKILTGGDGFPYIIELTDLDLKSGQDAIMAKAYKSGETLGGVTIFNNNGDGKLSEPTSNGRYVNDVNARGLGVVDMNMDCYPDLIVADWNRKRIIVLPNRGDGTFADLKDGVVVELPGTGALYLVTGDLNGDKRPDIAIGTSVGSYDLVYTIMNRPQ